MKKAILIDLFHGLVKVSLAANIRHGLHRQSFCDHSWNFAYGRFSRIYDNRGK